MFLKAKHNFIIYPFFKRYAVWLIKRNFSTARVVGSFNDQKLPILLIANHISWWDGFWAMYLNVKVLNRKFHFMMLEEQLRKFWFFNHTGGFSVKKKAKSIIETLIYTRELLNHAENMVLIFPQGEIETMHKQAFKFENGIDRILKDREGKVQVLFMANLVDYFSHAKPSITMYIQEFTIPTTNAETLQDAYNSFYINSVENQKLLKS